MDTYDPFGDGEEKAGPDDAWQWWTAITAPRFRILSTRQNLLAAIMAMGLNEYATVTTFETITYAHIVATFRGIPQRYKERLDILIKHINEDIVRG